MLTHQTLKLYHLWDIPIEVRQNNKAVYFIKIKWSRTNNCSKYLRYSSLLRYLQGILYKRLDIITIWNSDIRFNEGVHSICIIYVLF